MIKFEASTYIGCLLNTKVLLVTSRDVGL